MQAGKAFDTTTLTPEIKKALQDGMADAWAEFGGLLKKVEKGEITSGDLFGTRDFLKNNYQPTIKFYTTIKNT